MSGTPSDASHGASEGPLAMDAGETEFSADLFGGVDRSSPVPLYHQVAECIERAIRADVLRPGDRLENELAMSKRLGLSRPTVRQAIQQLVDKGLVVRWRGVGTRVTEAPLTRDAGISSLFDDLLASGQRPGTELLEQSVVEADEQVARALGVEVGDAVRRIVRLRSANDRPLALLDNTVPLDIGTFTPSELTEGSFYRLLRARGISVRITDQVVRARVATDAEASALALNQNEPVLTVMRTSFDSSGRAVELGRHSYAPDRYALRYSLVGR